MLPFYGTCSMGNIPSGSDLLHPFPFIRAIRAVQIFLSEFSKDGSVDLGDKFADGGVSNQPMVLHGGLCLSSGQVSQGYGQFESYFQWLDAVVNAFRNEVKRQVGILTKFWSPGMSVCMRSTRTLL